MVNNEEARLRSLRLYKILDTATEKAFDDLTRLAALICETPICLVSLVDEERQWFKSHHGLDVRETPIDQAFCAHAITQGETMVVEDAHEDVRFAGNALVTGNPHIRFYAGAPLTVADGSRLGTLCVIDREPGRLTQTQKEALEVLRDAVVAQIELRRAVDDLKELSSIVPMCAWCRCVRVEGAEGTGVVWEPLHEYVAKITSVTHGICEQCSKVAFHDSPA